MKNTTTIQANAQDRKTMVRAIAAHLGLKPRYEGTPSYNYTIGSITVTRACEIIGEVDEMETLKPFLMLHGYIEYEENNESAESAESAEAIADIEGDDGNEHADESVESEPVDEPNATETESESVDLPTAPDAPAEQDEPTGPDAPTDQEEPTEQEEPTDPDDDSTVSINLPCPELMVSGLINLIFMLHNKQHLLGKALGRQTIHIFDSVVQDLREQPPFNTEDFAERIASYRSRGQVIGFDYRAKCIDPNATGCDARDKVLSLVFPYSKEGGYGMVCADLVTRMVQAASKATRVKSDPLEPAEEAEKYYMNNWLVRLGFGGPEYKDHRRMLMQRLHGYATFKCKDRMEAHKAKLMAARKAERAAQEEATVEVANSEA